MGEGAKRVRISTLAAVGQAADAALLPALVDQDPGEQDEHRMGQAAGKDNRRNPDEKRHDGHEGPAREEDREGRQEEGEDVVHGVEVGVPGRGRKGGGIRLAGQGVGLAGTGLEGGWKPACRFGRILTGFGQDGGHSETGQETAPVDDRQRTNAQERAHLELMLELEKQAADWADLRLRRSLIPADWGKLDSIAPVRSRKKKVTVALDEDVARWFRGLGAGYHGRINAVLRTYMLALVSKEVLSLGDQNRHGDEVWGKAGRKRKVE